MNLHTYLNYGGNCAEAFRFYQEHLGGKITMMMTHAQQPGANNIDPEWKDAILYARITVAGTDIMASDVPPDRFQPMRSVYLSLSLDSSEEAERIYALLSNGGEIFMPSGQVRHVLDDSPRKARAVETPNVRCAGRAIARCISQRRLTRRSTAAIERVLASGDGWNRPRCAIGWK